MTTVGWARVRLFGAVGAVGLLTAGVAATVRLGPQTLWTQGAHAIWLFGALFALFLAGAWLVSGMSRGRALWVTLTGAVALQIASVTAPPRYSDDLYRYVWDGRVQAAGISPYRYVPFASQLAGLRAGSGLFPSTGISAQHCVGAGLPGITPGCTLMNRPLVHTIYPPVAEAYFFGVHWWGPKGVQVVAAVLALAVTALLVFGLPRVGLDARTAVLWAWCPTVALEAGNGGHVDVLGVLLTGFALLLLASGKVARGGLVLGLAIATKVTPALAVPGALRRRPLVLLGSIAGVVAAVYVPHMLAVGRGVTGFFGGYLQEEGYDSGKRFAIVAEVLPDAWVKPAVALVLAAAVALVWWRGDPARPWRGALVLTGVAMLVAAPAYPWYAELLMLFVAFEGWRALVWLPVAFAGYVVQAGDSAQWGYGIAALVIAANLAGVRAAARFKAPRPQGSAPFAAEMVPPREFSDGSVDVILPCLDESEALPYVLSHIPEGYHPIVVDNGSTDGSPELAERLGATVVREPLKGFGAACHAGLLAATADIVCFLDCDGSFDPRDLPKVTEPIRNGEADLALGQRRPLTRDAWPPHARLANRLLARRIRKETGVRISDLGPMRAARREALLGLEIQDRRYGYPLEMVLKAAQQDWRITETDVPYAPRTGKSKVTGTVGGTVKAVRDMRKVWKAATQ